jgi:hypothetical protein
MAIRFMNIYESHFKKYPTTANNAAAFPSLPLDSLLALATEGTQEGEGLGVGL